MTWLLAARHEHGIGLAKQTEAVLRSRILPSVEAWPSHWRSAVWMGLAASARGLLLKPYFNMNRGSARERWQRVGWTLADLGRPRSLEVLCELSKRVPRTSLPVGIALDLKPSDAVGRVKVYFRSPECGPEWLAGWYRALDALPHLNPALDLAAALSRHDEQRFPPGAFVLSLELHERDGLASLKADVAVTKWSISARALRTIVERVVARDGHSEALACEALRLLNAGEGSDPMSLLRFVGFGYEPSGSHHVNLYVEPPIHPAEGLS